MIYVIGDLHGDRKRLKKKNLGRIKKGEFLIICGDFGFIWNGSKKEKRYLKKLGKRKYHILFVDGAHENFKELEKYPVEEWNGGNTRHISGNLRHLMRGEAFTLAGNKVFAFGGGQLEEGDLIIEGYENSSAPELPTDDEFKHGMDMLAKLNNKVDYIVSYEAPCRIAEFLQLSKKDIKNLNVFLDIINDKCDFKRWFFGQYHINKIVSSKYYAVYDKVVKAE